MDPAEARTRKLRDHKLRDQPISRLLPSQAVPAVVTSLSTVLYSVVDMVFVGRLGTSALGAVSVSFPLFSVIGGIGLAFGIGAGNSVSRLLGAGRRDEAERVAAIAVISVLGLGVLIGIGGLRILERLLLRLGATGSILPSALEYSRILVLGSVVTIVNMVLSGLARSEGNASLSMVSMLAGTGANIVLDPLLIFGLRMGIAGAAAATVAAQMITLAILILSSLRGRSVVRIRIRRFPRSSRALAAMVMDILKIGIAPLVGSLLISVVIALLNTAAREFGDHAVAAVGIVVRILSFGMFLVFGYSRGLRPVAAYNLGAGLRDRVRQASVQAMVTTGIFTSAFALVMLVFAPSVLAFFSSDPAVIAIGGRLLRSASLLFPLFGPQIVLVVLCQVSGLAVTAGVLALTRQGLFFCLFAAVLPRVFGLRGLILTPLAADAAVACVFLLTFVLLFGRLKGALGALRSPGSGSGVRRS